MASENLVNVPYGSHNAKPDVPRTYQVVVAATRKMGIGKDGKLPWKLPSDLKFFKNITLTTADPGKKNAVVMGRKTWESIPLKFRPLPGRLNVVLTHSGSFDIASAENVVICGSFSSALDLMAASPYNLSIENVFVIGGGQILSETLNAPGCVAIRLTDTEAVSCYQRGSVCNLGCEPYSRFFQSLLCTIANENLVNVPNGSHNPKLDVPRSYQVVVAATKRMGIGKDGKLPWDLPPDLKFFEDITLTTSDTAKRNAVVMGRKTWESIPPNHRPLSGCLNVVLTRSGSYYIASSENVVICGSFTLALELMSASPYSLSIEKVFVIGGGQILSETLNAPGCVAIHLTDIETDIECDTFIPTPDTSVFQPWYSSFPLVENNIRYSFTTYVSMRDSPGESPMQTNGIISKLDVKKFSFLPEAVSEKHEEYQYLGLVKDIITNGITKDDRTGTGTLSKFGCQMRFNLRKYFPLLTTKKVFWRGVVEELLWFISGSTNAKILQEKGIHIWDGNTSRDYLDSLGLVDREEGDLGPVYGFQWRHFGARYINMHTDYTGQGFDQLLDVIDKIKNKPDDRRIILSAWNPSDLKLMALPPCHMFAQFYIANGELSCQMYQRSADMGLGVPFNIASYALLTCMIAHVCDLLPGDFVHVIGDAHVYSTHIQPLQDQLQNEPRPFPILKIDPQKREIDSFEPADFTLVGYNPHQKIGMKMAV